MGRARRRSRCSTACSGSRCRCPTTGCGRSTSTRSPTATGWCSSTAAGRWREPGPARARPGRDRVQAGRHPRVPGHPHPPRPLHQARSRSAAWSAPRCRIGDGERPTMRDADQPDPDERPNCGAADEPGRPSWRSLLPRTEHGSRGRPTTTGSCPTAGSARATLDLQSRHARGHRDPGPHRGHVVFHDLGGRGAVRRRPRAVADHPVDRPRAGRDRAAAARLPRFAAVGALAARRAAAAGPRAGHRQRARPGRRAARPPRAAADRSAAAVDQGADTPTTSPRS